MKKKIKLAVGALLLMTSTAKADLFSLTLTQGANTQTRSYKSVLDIFDAYEDGNLESILYGYNPGAAANGVLDFRGIRMELDYGADGRLTLNILRIGIVNEIFGQAGGTQEQAFKAFKDYLKNNQDDLLKKILKESVANTPYDSIAGNPASLMSQMTDMAFQNPTLTATERAMTSGQTGGFVSLSPSAGQHKIKGEDGKERTATTFNLPLGYTFKFNNNWALGIDMPLSYIDIDGSITYAAQIGATLQIPVTKKWFISPSVRVGATGSEDSLSGGVLYMASVSSNYTMDFGNTSVTIINMYAHIKDYTLDIKGYDIEYGLRNNVFKNGISIKQSLTEKTALTIFGYDTRFTGSDLYVDSYDEVGFSYTKYFSGNSFFTGLGFTASYTFGDNYKAYRAGFELLF